MCPAVAYNRQISQILCHPYLIAYHTGCITFAISCIGKDHWLRKQAIQNVIRACNGNISLKNVAWSPHLKGPVSKRAMLKLIIPFCICNSPDIAVRTIRIKHDNRSHLFRGLSAAFAETPLRYRFCLLKNDQMTSLASISLLVFPMTRGGRY